MGSVVSKALLLVITLLPVAYAQELPDKIRGYKVHKANITINTSKEEPAPDGTSDVIVKIAKPTIVSMGLLSVAVDVGGEFTPSTQTGNVDFMTFRDIRVNGIAVEADEYRTQFSFKKNSRTELPKPVRATLRLTGIAKTAFAELTKSQSDWIVTGTVFVFGRFNKLGFNFKRVVPIKIALKVQNPLR
jgi:hypothetical protein